MGSQHIIVIILFLLGMLCLAKSVNEISSDKYKKNITIKTQIDDCDSCFAPIMS